MTSTIAQSAIAQSAISQPAIAQPAELPVQRCPVDHSGMVGAAPTAPSSARPVDRDEALDFLELFYAESDPDTPFEQRLREVNLEIDETGCYTHTLDELTFGARVAWRNAARCIGRLYWNSLRIRDLRHVTSPGRGGRRAASSTSTTPPAAVGSAPPSPCSPRTGPAGRARASTTTS